MSVGASRCNFSCVLIAPRRGRDFPLRTSDKERTRSLSHLYHGVCCFRLLQLPVGARLVLRVAPVCVFVGEVTVYT